MKLRDFYKITVVTSTVATTITTIMTSRLVSVTVYNR